MTKAEIYQNKKTALGWFWKIQLEKDFLMGYAYTRLGAEWQARREWRRHNSQDNRYEIALDGEQ